MIPMQNISVQRWSWRLLVHSAMCALLKKSSRSTSPKNTLPSDEYISFRPQRPTDAWSMQNALLGLYATQCAPMAFLSISKFHSCHANVAVRQQTRSQQQMVCCHWTVGVQCRGLTHDLALLVASHFGESSEIPLVLTT